MNLNYAINITSSLEVYLSEDIIKDPMVLAFLALYNNYSTDYYN